MQRIKTIQLIEGILIPFLVLCYAGRRLVEIAREFDLIVRQVHSYGGVPIESILENLDYNHRLNTIFPIIAGAVFMIAAWVIFHFFAFPRIKEGQLDFKLAVLLTLTTILIFSGDSIFHYFRHYISFNHAGGATNALHSYVIFRKKILLSDFVAIAIIFGTYELFAQLYYFLATRFESENYPQLGEESSKSIQLNIINILLPIPVICFLLYFVLLGTLPSKVWTGSQWDILFICGCLLLIMILHSVLYNYILPYLGSLRPADIAVSMLGFLSLGVSGCLVITLTSTNFMNFNKIMFSKALFVTLFFSAALAYIRKSVSLETADLQTRVSAKTAELASLRSQINPHFLFNALNSLYTAALKEGSDRTADGIQKLGDMMRFMLQENNRDRIPLQKEIEYLDNYIHIQRIRIDESQGIDIRVHIERPEQDIYIAPMMLLPFVENAFKHGLSHIYPSWIYITLSFDKTSLYFKIHNSLHAKQEKDPEERSGIGLENVKKRLELIYPNRYKLEIQPSGQDYFVGLRIQYW